MNPNVNEYNFYNSSNLNGEEIREILLLEEKFLYQRRRKDSLKLIKLQQILNLEG